MSALRAFTQQTRQEIVRSTLNTSKAKNLWTFSKQKRFPEQRSTCPQLAYEKNTSTISNKKIQFGNSRRKVFTEVSEAPTSWMYNPNVAENKNAATFGQSRSKCINNSYIPIALGQNPGPGRYIYEHPERGAKFTMRPKTANNRTYFINNKEQAVIPSPCEYNVTTGRINGRSTVSKFKTIMLGGSGLMSKEQRFREHSQNTPSSWMYNVFKPNNFKRKAKGGKIGMDTRQSFIDDTKKASYTPGPGNYKMPTDFGHYKRMSHSIAH